jgi:arginine decarboxylase
VDVKLAEDGHFAITGTFTGDTVARTLQYVNFQPEQLRHAYRQKLAASNLPAERQQQFLDELNAGLDGYTYLEE